MKLSGGKYGGFELLENTIELEGQSFPIVFGNNPSEFFVDDNLSEKLFYRIDETAVVYFKVITIE